MYVNFWRDQIHLQGCCGRPDTGLPAPARQGDKQRGEQLQLQRNGADSI